MKTTAKNLLILALLTLVPVACEAQCTTNSATGCGQGVPHFIKFNGTLKNAAGAPQGSFLAVRFVIYSDSTGGTPLWQEVQNTPVDSQGHYEVLLGSTAPNGMPMDIFTSGEPRWLGAQVIRAGSEEEPRVLMVSVPYALESADAQTLGGLPASAFARVVPSGSSETTPGAQTVIASPAPQSATGTTVDASSIPPVATASGIAGITGPVNVIPKFSGGGLASSQITDTGGTVSLQNLSNILFADRFPQGVPDAVAACPANGCIIYALSPSVNLNLGTIDPGTKAITIYLGPYTYTVKQITLRKALKIIGMGATGGVTTTTQTCSSAAPCNGTALRSINGNNPVFVLPQANNAPATNVLLSGFRLLGSVGNTSEDGFFLDTKSLVNSGLWYSTFDDIYIAEFAGVGMHIRGRNDNFSASSQWLRFNKVVVWRTSGGGNALRLEGSVFALRFADCEFDGQVIGDGTNIYVGGLAGGSGGYPTTIIFEALVSQQAALAVQIDGGVNLTFYGSHHEELWAGYQITANTNVATRGLTISDSYFAGNVGINGGSGYELNVTTTSASGIFFVHNQIFGNADSVVKGTNLASVVYQDNMYSGNSNVPPTSGVTTQMNPAATINIVGVHSVGLNSSSTPITTIQSALGPGEMVTLFTFIGPVTFASGGNINLMGQNTLTVNGSITFVRNDLLGSLQWIPVSQWSPTPASPTPH